MASLIKRNNTWYVQHLKNGKWVRVSCKTSVKKIAQEVLHQYRLAEAQDNNDFQHRSKACPSLGEFYKRHIEYANGSISPGWIREKKIYFKAHLLPFFGEATLLKDISLAKIQQYQSERRSKVSARTVNIEVICLMRLLRQAVEWGDLDPKYLPKPKKIKEQGGRVRFLEEQEIKKLLDAASSHDSNMEAYVRLMLYAGLRSGEALNLRWMDLDLERRFLTVTPRKDWVPKNKKSRIVPLPDDFVTFLLDRKAQFPDSELIVVGNHDCSIKVLKRSFLKVAERAGLPTTGENKVTAHTLRHTYATHLVMNGTPLYTVTALLGHSDAKTTQIYAHLAPEHLKEAVNNLRF